MASSGASTGGGPGPPPGAFGYLQLQPRDRTQDWRQLRPRSHVQRLAHDGGIVGHDYNRFAGDLLDGSFDRLNPSFARMLYETNRNEITYTP